MDGFNASLDHLTPQNAPPPRRPSLCWCWPVPGRARPTTLTRAFVQMIEARGIPEHRVLAVTFTNKAAAEMSGRIRQALGDDAAPCWIGTFHGFGARQLRIEPEVAGLRSGFDILDANDSKRIVKRVMKGMNLARGDDGASTGRDPL